jgi:crotonobetainyl-CoA:carnitine CoA-transferase CaiB-like acyl-CoA transferase
MILADFGADVVRVEPPEAGNDWSEPRDLLLNRGKRSIRLDLSTDEGRGKAFELVRGVDVLVEAVNIGRPYELGSDYDALCEMNPGLVYCSISGFGAQGPFRLVKPDDGLVMAKAGIFRDQPGWHQANDRTVYRSCKDPSYFAAMLAVQGILAALRARDRTGLGQRVETSLLQALTCRHNPKNRWMLREHEELPPDTLTQTSDQGDAHTLAHHRDPRETGLINMMVECKDGRWITHALVQPEWFPAWTQALGLEWIWEDDRFKGAPNRFPDSDAKADLAHLIELRMKEKTAAEWMEAYIATGNVCGDAVQTTQEALRHRQAREAGLVVEFEDPRVGPMLQIGPLAKIPTAPAAVRGPAPDPGQHTSEVLSGGPPPTTPAADGNADRRAPELKGPLDGITVIEAAYYYATPFATALLAEMGARVIKIEPLAGDPYRALTGDGSTDPVLNLGHNNMVRSMQGKESIAVNLKDPRGQEIVHRLVARADAFIHSFRPGAPGPLGIDETTLHRINPSLVYHYGASYGSTGPYAHQPAIDPVIAAFAGQTAYQVGEGNRPLTETGADPIAAAGHATALMLGLYAHHRTGKAQDVESAMVVSNIYLNCEDALSYDGKPPRPPVDAMQLGTGACHRLYETAPAASGTESLEHYRNANPHWVFLSAEDDDEFSEFCHVAGRSELARDPRFATVAARGENRSSLEAILERVFLTRTARQWETSLLEVGVGCVTADAMSHFAFLHGDEQARAIGMMTTTEHPSFGGTYLRHAPLLNFSRTPGVPGAYCEKGEHTRALLRELGYDDADVVRLKEANVVTWPAEREPVMVST